METYVHASGIVHRFVHVYHNYSLILIANRGSSMHHTSHVYEKHVKINPNTARWVQLFMNNFLMNADVVKNVL